MNTPRPVIFGEVLFDCFEDGGRVLGGAPFNVAWHLAGFGVDPLFVSRIGDDAMGDQIRAAMQRQGMDTRSLQTDPFHSTGEVRVTLHGGQPEFDILDDRAFDYITEPELAEPAPALVYHGTLALRHARSRGALDSLLATHRTPVFLDVNLRTPWWQRDTVDALVGGARWLKVNDAELELLSPVDGDLSTMARAVLERHDLARIVVTRGERGALGIERGGDVVEVAPSGNTRVVDTVGAGDAFAAVCILGLIRDWPLDLTLERAQHFASLLVARRGAVPEDPEIYRELGQRWQ